MDLVEPINHEEPIDLVETIDREELMDLVEMIGPQLQNLWIL